MRKPARDTLAGSPGAKDLFVEIKSVGSPYGAQNCAVEIGALFPKFILQASI